MLQFNDSTSKASLMVKLGDNGIVPTPMVGDETPLALVLVVLGYLESKWLNV